MPKVPEYNRQVGTVKSANLTKIQADLTGEKLIEQAGNQLLRIEEKLDNVNQYRIKTEAELGLQSELNALKVKSFEEPDINKKKEYMSQVDSIVSKWNDKVMSMGNTETKAEFERIAKFSGQSVSSSIYTDYQRNIVQAGKDSLQLTLMNAIEKAKTSDPSSIGLANTIAGEAIDDAVRKGIITFPAGQLMRKETAEAVSLQHLYSLAEDDPQSAKEQLSAHNLSAKNEKLIREQIKIKEEEQIQKVELQNLDNKIQIIGNIPNDVNLKTVYDMESMGVINKETADNYRTRLMNGPGAEPTFDNPIEYDRLMSEKARLYDINSEGKVKKAKGDFFLSKKMENKKASSEFIEKALNSWIKGGLTESGFRKITNDVLNLSNSLEDPTAQSKMVAYKQIQRLAVNDNPLTSIDKTVNLYNQISEQVGKMNFTEAEKYAKEVYYKSVGKEYRDTPSNVPSKDTELKVGGMFQGGKIKAVRPK